MVINLLNGATARAAMVPKLVDARDFWLRVSPGMLLERNVVLNTVETEILVSLLCSENGPSFWLGEDRANLTRRLRTKSNVVSKVKRRLIDLGILTGDVRVPTFAANPFGNLQKTVNDICAGRIPAASLTFVMPFQFRVTQNPNP